MSALNLDKFDYPVPRYTSYPTVPEWTPLDASSYAQQLDTLPDGPLSLYCHIPFCHKMCLYCGCSVILNRHPDREATYLTYLLKELALVAAHVGKREVVQLHIGGGTPTKLSPELLSTLFSTLYHTFSFTHVQEIAIEVDPRTVAEDGGEKLRLLKACGVTRVSFGVQDTDPKVQEAVKRRQSLEMTTYTYHYARSLGFTGINIDLIYGLPCQTCDSFQKTVVEILKMRPDRISLFSYARLPALKKHQLAIKEETLPSREEKFRIYQEARQRFVAAGYVAIGMDHFALADDEITQALRTHTLGRNFQGYTRQLADVTLGLGITAIGSLGNAYVQNQKELPLYYAALDAGHFPVHRGIQLSADDRLRREVIHTLMSYFVIDKAAFAATHGYAFDTYFATEGARLAELEQEGLLVNTPTYLYATKEGELLIRIVASAFDAYIKPYVPTVGGTTMGGTTFSRSV